MGNKLYVGNLSFNTTEIAIQDLFSQCGSVSEVMLMQDKFTGRSRGFAFVTMSSDEEAQAAVNQMHGKELDGRALTVNEARPREDRPAGAGGHPWHPQAAPPVGRTPGAERPRGHR